MDRWTDMLITPPTHYNPEEYKLNVGIGGSSVKPTDNIFTHWRCYSTVDTTEQKTDYGTY